MFMLSVDHIPQSYRNLREWFTNTIPLFDCPDPSFLDIYYFRWSIYKKHIRPTPDGYVVTEFLPDVPWAGKYNTISAPLGHHLYEGRWLRIPNYLDDYTRFWFAVPGAAPRAYSTWFADAVYARALVSGDMELPVSLLDALIANDRGWEEERYDPCGLFWQVDDRDGMEFQISGSGCRPTINSYLYGDALAITHIAELVGRNEIASRYRLKAEQLKALVQERLWDAEAQFFKTLPTEQALEHHVQRYRDRAMEPHYLCGKLVPVRELQGYLPWYFNLPDPGYEHAWQQLIDPQGFAAPYGPSTAERRSPYWLPAPGEGQHACLWRGSSWPFATSQTLTALANLLNNYEQHEITRQDYFQLLQGYTRTQYLELDDGQRVPWIDESVHPDTGEWVTRTVLYKRHSPQKDRGRDYNHSTFADHIITGLVGLRPRADSLLEVNPLLPAGTWSYFCLDGVKYHGHLLTILYDQDGTHYGRGAGFHIYKDDTLIGLRKDLGRVEVSL